jgi:hypothetical protein
VFCVALSSAQTMRRPRTLRSWILPAQRECFLAPAAPLIDAHGNPFP